ncbi:MAG: molecular chaperone TorD family protein [Sulfuriferula sp.]|nr:molecular chaperone TorD family protein [Sulfuriferula sp.]
MYSQQTDLSAASVAADCAGWHFCAMLLAEPDAESLAILSEQAGLRDWLAPALHELSAMPLDAWQGEHTHLFTFPAVCPPFATAYLEEGTLNGHRAAALESYYAALGLRPTGLPADYLGTICECAAFLCEHGDRVVLQDFCQDYLGDWLDRFLEDLRTKSNILLYQGLALELGSLVYELLNDEVTA